MLRVKRIGKQEGWTFRVIDSVDEEQDSEEISHKTAFNTCVNLLENLISFNLTSTCHIRAAAYSGPAHPAPQLLHSASFAFCHQFFFRPLFIISSILDSFEFLSVFNYTAFLGILSPSIMQDVVWKYLFFLQTVHWCEVSKSLERPEKGYLSVCLSNDHYIPKIQNMGIRLTLREKKLKFVFYEAPFSLWFVLFFTSCLKIVQRKNQIKLNQNTFPLFWSWNNDKHLPLKLT